MSMVCVWKDQIFGDDALVMGGDRWCTVKYSGEKVFMGPLRYFAWAMTGDVLKPDQREYVEKVLLETVMAHENPDSGKATHRVMDPLFQRLVAVSNLFVMTRQGNYYVNAGSFSWFDSHAVPSGGGTGISYVTTWLMNGWDLERCFKMLPRYVQTCSGNMTVINRAELAELPKEDKDGE